MEEEKINEYNDIPVYYCTECLSLKIISLNDEQCFCDECGNTDIEECNIKDWEEMYKAKYNHFEIDDGFRKVSKEDNVPEDFIPNES